jgi:LCCL domain
MKAVQELVSYFDRRGRLSKKQLRALLEQGFLAGDAPANMLDLCQPLGATYYFRVTGDVSGQVWGTDVYTGDSTLAAATVHAGLVKPGEQAVVRIVVMDPPAGFLGSIRNGVTSHDFGRFGSAYRIEKI